VVAITHFQTLNAANLLTCALLSKINSFKQWQMSEFSLY